MTLTIKDPQTVALARQLAQVTGQTITEAVRDALAARLEEKERGAGGLAERLLEIGRRSAAVIGPGPTSLDHGDLLYDEMGLPHDG
jgi:antitoxin VapB